MSTQPSEAAPYFDLAARLHEIAVLNSVAGLLSWDEQVMLPSAGVAWRSEQAATMARLTHERVTDPTTADLLAAAEAAALDDDQRVVVREFRRDLDRSTRLPAALVTEMSRVTVLSQAAWVEARAVNDFGHFAPWLDRVLALKRQEAACCGEAGADPYDALLDTYEPGETAARLRPLFADLKPRLTALLDRVLGATRRPRPDVLTRPLPVDAQQRLMRRLVEVIGFDVAAGRIDTSVHPFCTGLGPGDTRITTRYSPTDFAGALLGTLHESGHAMYEQGLPKARFVGTALATAASLGVHESQSRLWENQIGRGPAFNAFFWPMLRDAFAAELHDVTASDWLAAINVIEPSFVRTEADELTYNLHVLLRFDLEHALINGRLSVADLPTAWNAAFHDLLGLRVPDDRAGCLQDVHWSAGLIGYFPTYTLGNLYAAQLYEAITAAMPTLQNDLAAGRFEGLLGWLREHVHRHGQRYPAEELCRRATGQDRSAGALLRRLECKVSDFYGV